MNSDETGNFKKKKDKIDADAFFMLPPEEWDQWEQVDENDSPEENDGQSNNPDE
ncbi:hypothetical protein AB9P05_05260 [Roseivirga sp. BDSF3-8]|uniref:hypothetical protein n=1 Tax=Roseivirga sp. BDSF3-8 TaxID=3241598 RepID=UPI00353222E0